MTQLRQFKRSQKDFLQELVICLSVLCVLWVTISDWSIMCHQQAEDQRHQQESFLHAPDIKPALYSLAVIAVFRTADV